MLIKGKIRLLRLEKGWSQESVAAKLDMSLNGYGCIERGETNVSVPRLEQIALLHDLNIREFFCDVDKQSAQSVLNSMGTNNSGTQNNQTYCSYNFNSEDCKEKCIQHDFDMNTQLLLNKSQLKENLMLEQLNKTLQELNTQLKKI